MRARTGQATRALVRDFLSGYPHEAASFLDSLDAVAIVELAASQTVGTAAGILSGLQVDRLAEVLERLDDRTFARVVGSSDPARVAAALSRLGEEARQGRLALLDARIAEELTAAMTYPADSAGALMDPGVSLLRRDSTVRAALTLLRRLREKRVWELYVVDDDGRLVGRVTLPTLAVSDPKARVGSLMATHPTVVPATSSREAVVEILERHRVESLPVVDFDNRVIGVLRHDALVTAVAEEASADIQTMVGASRDERALSPVMFTVAKRLPWLQVNLLTAFLAAFVVGLFQDTIASFTALAVLLPVVAGQSGNTGAQALAVTMRGLALREIRLRQWLRVAVKELSAGFINGVLVAAVTGLAVFVWSRSLGLTVVIGVAMVISMTIAGLSGAAIPLVLTTLRQDPAQSSSIVLTTVTDVVGFLTFLGLATLASGML